MPLFHRLFVYGTLLDAAVRRRVTRSPHQPDHLPRAVLKNFRRVGVPGETYPAVHRLNGHSVKGGLLDVRSDREWRRLKAYETDEYRLDRVSVLLPGTNSRTTAWCFILRRHVGFSRQGWNLDQWRDRHRTHTLSRRL